MTMSDIERRVSHLVDTLMHDVPPLAAEEVLALRKRSRDRQAAILGVAAMLLAIGLSAAVAINRVDDTPREVQAIAGPPRDHPVEPPPDSLAGGPVSLVLSSNSVASGSANLSATLTATSENDLEFGVLAEIHRWDGDSWAPHRNVVMCLEEWDCIGEPYPLDEDGPRLPYIGIGADPSEPGPTQSLTTAGLEEGWYRLVQQGHDNRTGETGGAVATAIFEVRSN